MPDDFSIQVEGLDSVMWRIKSLPDTAKNEILTDVTDYSLEVIREPAPQRYVTRKEAYGQTFFSDKQRRYFFASLADGTIQVPYRRTGNLGESWSAARSGDSVVFRNSAPYAPYVQGFVGQSRHAAKIGWEKITKILDGKLSFRSSRFRSVVMAATQKAIRKLNLG